MVKITYVNTDGTVRTVDAEIGSTVMETAVKNDIPGIVAECGGSCICSTCHVYVDDAWIEKVGPRTASEVDTLEQAIDVRPNSHLSCQITVTEKLDGLLVRTPAEQR